MPDPDPAPAPSRCDPTSFADFECSAQTRCRDVDLDDERIDLLELLCLVRAHRGESLATVLGATPISFRKNFTAKHGLDEHGSRGHAFEDIEQVVGEAVTRNSQAAEPTLPRALIWDERTGLSIAFNSGAAHQHGAARLDLLRFDEATQSFDLWALDLPLGATIEPYQPHTEVDDCAHCHGPHGRPIWPMYPEWPGFYGSDNDELDGHEDPQRHERELWAEFRACVESDCPDPASRSRYAPLLNADLQVDLREHWPTSDADAIATYVRGRPRAAQSLPPTNTAALADWLGLSTHSQYPYRPDISTRIAQPSRAFFHRPNLRLGVLYNRLLARAVVARLREDPVYRSAPRTIALTLMDCGWAGDDDLQANAQRALSDVATKRLAATGHRIDPHKPIAYPVLLAALGLRVRDVDMRFSYPNQIYDRFDPPAAAPLMTDNIMHPGRIPYRAGDRYAVGSSSSYFNSYFDGSATFDELWVAHILDGLAATDPALAAVYQPRTLAQKYAHLIPRWALDQEFFESVDAMGRWMPLPFPQHVREAHDRESFYKRRGGTKPFIDPYLAVCKELRRGIGETTRSSR